MEALVTGPDRTELLRALAQQLEPSLPDIRSQLRTQEDLAFVVAGLLAQAVSQIEGLLWDDGREGQVRDSGFWYAWDAYMAQRGRLATQDGEHWLPEIRLHRSESVPGGPTESPLGQLIRVAVQAGVRAATSEPTVTEAVVEQTLADGKTKRTTVRTTRRAADEKPTRATTD